MSSPDSSPPASTIPLVRDCRPGGLRPLLSPGGRDTYFSNDVQRMLFPSDEAFARFLPPAKWTMPERQERAQDGRAPQVTYTIPDEIIKTATPLATLPRAEIDAFSDAIAAFLAKARPDAKGVTPFMRQCRLEFRLPNPEFDPGAYWVYGPEFDRRLLILWGVEPQAGTSLTLEQVLEKLLAREMSWRDKQDLALKLALRPGEPISRFLARRTADGGLQAGGTTIPAKKLNRLRTVAPGEWRAFEEAAKAYYAKAHPGGTAPPFERELRREFRLPSYEQVPGDFYAAGGKFLIALDTWPKEVCLPATDDSKLALLEPASTASSVAAPAASSATVSAQLKARQQPPWVFYAKLAASVAIVAVIGAAAWVLRPDRTPPEFRSIEALDRNTIVIAFNEGLDPASIQPRLVTGQPPADPITFFESKLEIADRSLSDANRGVVIIHTKTPLKHGEKYDLGIKLVADGAHNTIEPLSKQVVFYDKVAPKLVEVSAGGPTKRHLVLVFSKAMSDDFRKARFDLAPIDGDERGKKIPVSPALDPEDPTKVLVEAGDDFIENKPYVIDVSGLFDRLDPQPNGLAEAGATNRKFDYVNRLAPALRGGPIANGGQYEIKLQFNGRLDAVRAKDVSNYTVTTPDNATLHLRPGGASLDETETLVTLELEPARLSPAKHKLRIERLASKLGVPVKAPIETLFEFNDATNRTPLAITELERNGSRLTLRFDRAVARDSAFTATRYAILDGQRRKSDIEVQKAEVVSGQTALVALQLSRAPAAGQYFVEVSGLADVFGNAQEAPALKGFQVSGVTLSMPSLIDWAQPPLLRAGGTLLVISISDRVTKATATDLANYTVEPAGVQLFKVVEFKAGTEDQPVTTVTWSLKTQATGRVSVSAHGLILEAYPGRGAQTLKMREAMLAQ